VAADYYYPRYYQTRRYLDAGEQRALYLLWQFLSAEQRTSLERRGWFEVRGSRGGRWWLSLRGDVRRRRRWGKGYVGYCMELQGSVWYPPGDRLLALMLALRTNERGFRKEACRIG